MTVTHFQRRPFAHNFSIERVFATIRAALPAWVDCRVAVCRHNGTWPGHMLWNMLEAAWRQTDVNHVTGDTSYLVGLLPKRKTLLTVHDCVGMQRLQGWRRRFYRWWWLCVPVRRCGLVTVISEQVRREVMAYTGCAAAKIRIVPDPVGEEFRPAPRKFCARMPIILQVGTAFNKNIGRVAEALKGIECELHIVGRLDAGDRRRLDEAGVHYRVSFGLTGAEMVRAYEECDLVMFASTYEGFGMPIVEAQAVGRPVVTSAIEPMAGVAGGAACLVDPLDAESIRAGVLRVIGDAGWREQLVRRGWENAKRYGGEAIAAAYAAIYRELTPAPAAGDREDLAHA